MDNNSEWQQIKEIFSSALDLEPQNRSQFVLEACSGNDRLRKEVESWLASYAESADFIETPAFEVGRIFTGGVGNGNKRFGHYKIIQEIGYGGMGAVFLAERDDGEFSQRVAIKIIRQSIAESELINRFKRERQILATLNHPNIAKLLDGGVSDDGLPFLAMEFVDGVTITEFSDTQNLNLEGRLMLFLKVCTAVAYAHRNLIVHRDLKPSNILVTDDGEPKLLDFGLAKLMDDNLSVDSTQTQTAFRALTPAYASPEQLTNKPITTASDIYSLGIVLYELLTNERPFRFEGKSLDEIIRTVAQNEPQLPSLNRHTRRDMQLTGDLDNIVLMALRKEPERRYHSVEAFAQDIERYLKGLPISARPSTYKYRASKFIRRHKVGVFAGTLVFLSLVGGIVASLWQARIAQKENEKAAKINAFLEKTLKYSNPILSNLRKAGRETTVNEVLDEAARRLDSGEFDGFPEVKAELERTVANAYFGQGRYIQARKHMEQHVLLLKQLYGENDSRMIYGSLLWAALLFDKNELTEAEGIYRKYLPLLKSEFDTGSIRPEIYADAVNNFAYLRRTQGDSTEAESLFRQTLEIIPLLSGDEINSVATTRSTLASTIADQGRFDEALETARQAVDEYRARNETDTPNYGFSLTIYGGLLTEKRNFEEADKCLRDADAIFRKYLSSTNLWVGDNVRNQAVSLYGQGQYSDAIVKADEALKLYEDSFGKHYDNYPTALIAKGLSLTKMGHSGEGEKTLREAVELRTEMLTPTHYWVALAKSALGECLAIQERFDEAEPLLLESYQSLNRSQGAQNPRTQLARSRLYELYKDWNKPDLAAQYDAHS